MSRRSDAVLETAMPGHDERQLTIMRGLLVAGILGCVLTASPAVAASCGGDFETFISTFRREAAQQGVSPRALAALDGVTPNPQVISLDHRQGAFGQSFEQFSGHR